MEDPLQYYRDAPADALMSEAMMWKDQSGDVVLVEVEWRFEERYPLSRLGDPEEWREWFEGEVEAWSEEGQPGRYDDMLDRPIEEPVIVFEEPRPELWDGNHRTGASFAAGRRTIPAIVGRRRR